MDHVTEERIHELAAGYALDALDPAEREEFEGHLDGCARCRDELAAFAVAADGLAHAAEGPAPPEQLRARVLEAARAERPAVVPLRSRRWSAPWAAAVAAAACLAIGLGLWATLGGSNGSKAREPQTLALSGAQGRLEVDRVGNAQLVVSSIARAPAGKTYEIWVIPKGEAPQRAGLFAGGGAVSVKLARKVPAKATVAVTVERAGGTNVPTSPIRFSTAVPA